MMAMRRLIVVLILAFSATALAGVSKVEWMAQMQQQLPITFCKPGWYFRECFRITETECVDTASYTTRQCLRDIESKLPPTLDETSGREWGTKVGTCAGSAFELALSSKKVNSTKCNDPSNWLPR